MERDKDWEVLDTCLSSNDMRLVSSAYAFLKDMRHNLAAILGLVH